MFSWKHKDKRDQHGSEAAVPKPGYMDRAVGTLKQAAGRAFDEPDLYLKGQRQAKYGSTVRVNEQPTSVNRPWVGHGKAHPEPTVITTGITQGTQVVTSEGYGIPARQEAVRQGDTHVRPVVTGDGYGVPAHQGTVHEVSHGVISPHHQPDDVIEPAPVQAVPVGVIASPFEQPGPAAVVDEKKHRWF